MAIIVYATNVPTASAKRASEYLRRRNILSKITKDGTTKIEVFIPHMMTAEQTLDRLKTALDYDPLKWFFRHTELGAA